MDEQGYKREQLTPEEEKKIARIKERAMNKPDETEADRLNEKLTGFEDRKQQRVVPSRVDRRAIAKAQRNQRRQNLPFVRKR